MNHTTKIKPVNAGIIIVYQGATLKREFAWSNPDKYIYDDAKEDNLYESI